MIEPSIEPAAQCPPPPFDPDIELIDHLEGNRRERAAYRAAAARLTETVAEQAGRNGHP
jgi:hypothetical protein